MSRWLPKKRLVRPRRKRRSLKAVFGLGNPGLEYALTRHNAGFQVVDLYRRIHRLKRRGILVRSCLVYRGDDLLLAKPMTFMNESGEAVASVLKRFDVAKEDSLIVYDDLDLPLGTMKVLPGGGPGTHKGMISVLSALGSREVPRLRIGIGREEREEETVDYVLGTFSSSEWSALVPVLERAVDAVDFFRSSDIDVVMTKFNRRDGDLAPAENAGTLRDP